VGAEALVVVVEEDNLKLKKQVMMNYFLIPFMLLNFSIMAQDVTDALRFSTQEINGTARYTAMGGAFRGLWEETSQPSISTLQVPLFF